jgi:hypothetical protein
MTASAIPLVIGAVLAAVALVLAARARTWRDRIAGVALAVLNLLLFGGPVLLWPCGEGDCGPVYPIYGGLLAVTLVVLVASLWAGRRGAS